LPLPVTLHVTEVVVLPVTVAVKVWVDFWFTVAVPGLTVTETAAKRESEADRSRVARRTNMGHQEEKYLFSVKGAISTQAGYREDKNRQRR
jgi:hypothetical protein